MPIEKETYQLVVRINIEAFDSIQARDEARKIINFHRLDGMNMKLQQIKDGCSPRGIRL